MLKYSDKQKLGVGDSTVSSASGVHGGAPASKASYGISAAQKMYLLATVMAISVSRIMSVLSQNLPFTLLLSEFQDFPISTTLQVDFQDQGHFPGLSRRRGNLVSNNPNNQMNY